MTRRLGLLGLRSFVAVVKNLRWCLVAVPCACGDGDALPRGPAAHAGAAVGGSVAEAGAGGTAEAGVGTGATGGVEALGGADPGGGAAGAWSSAGDGGGGGAPSEDCSESPVATAFCNDGNPCTLDACNPRGGCTHLPLADGEVCEDGNACTTGERCLAGACVGAPRDERATLLGSVQTFGGFAEGGAAYQGRSAILSDELLVFAEPLLPGMALRLVERDGSELRLLHEVRTLAPLESDTFGLIGDVHIGTHLVPLSPSRLALVSSHFAVEVFDVVNRELVRRDHEWLDHPGWELAAVGFDSHLYTCGEGLEVYEVASDGQVSLSQRIPEVWPCRDLALSPARDRLYLATTRDVRVFDLKDPSLPERSDTIVRPGHYYTGVAASPGGQLALQEDVVFDTAGPASVLSALDFSEQQAFPSRYHDTSVYGVGFIGSSLALQYERVSNGEVALSLETFSLQTAPATRRAAYTFARYADAVSARTQVYSLATRGQLAVVAPTRQVLSVATDSISELKGMAQGHLSRVVSAGPGKVAAYGSSSSHLVDVTDPSRPKLIAGGLLVPGTGGPLSFQSAGAESAPAWLGFEAGPTVVPQAPSLAKVVQFEQRDGSAPQPVGHLRIEGGYASRATASGLLFELRRVLPGPGHTLRSYALPREPAMGEALTPFAEQPLDTSGMTASSFGVDIAQSRGSLVLAGQATDDESRVQLRWLERASDRWEVAAQVALPTPLTTSNQAEFVAVRGNIAVVGSEVGRRLHVVERTATGLSLVATRDFTWDTNTEPFEERVLGKVLGFEGDRVYLSGVYWDAEYVAHARVLTFDLTTLDLIAEYTVPEEVRSMTASDGKLVFGMASHLVVAEPECAAEPQAHLGAMERSQATP